MALVRTITFPKEPVPRTSWISYCFFLLAEGGWGITLWETSENMMLISLPSPCYILYKSVIVFSTFRGQVSCGVVEDGNTAQMMCR
jgi:hypothetical protein